MLADITSKARAVPFLLSEIGFPMVCPRGRHYVRRNMRQRNPSAEHVTDHLGRRGSPIHRPVASNQAKHNSWEPRPKKHWSSFSAYQASLLPWSTQDMPWW